MTALNKPQLQKPEPGDRTQESGLLHPATGISETSWQIIIFAISMVVILFSVYCLSHGITIIFMHLYYLPIVLLAYRYRYRGFVLSVILSLAYIVLVLFYSMGQNEIIIGALFRFVVFIGIAAVVAYLSEQFHQSEKSLKKVADIQESSLMNANVWLMLLDRRGRVLLWNNAAERISGYSAAEVTGSTNIWKHLYPDKDYRAVITKKIERIIAEDSFFENLETTIRTRSGEEKVISWNTRSFPVTSEQEARSIAIGIDITGRKVAEDELVFSERKFAAAFQASPDPIAISEIQTGKILDINQAFEDWSGYLREEMSGKTTRDLNFWVYPEERDSIVGILNTQGYVHKKEVTFRNKKKELRNILFSAKVLKTGDKAYMLSLAEDVTERKRSEEALRESEEKYRALFAAESDGIFVVDKETGTIIDCNDAITPMYGYRKDEVVGQPNTIMSAEPDATRAATNEVKTLIPIRYHKRKDGSVFPVEITANVVSVKGHDVIVAAVRDITERKKAEEALRKNAEELHASYEELTASEEELQHNLDELTRQERALRTLSAYNRSLLEASLDPLVTINPEGKIADVNLSTEKVTGYSREELIGTDFTNYFAEPAKAKEGYQRVFTDGTVRDYPLSIRNRDGHITPVLYNATVYRDESGNIGGVFAAARDITERKRSEDALLRVNQKLNVLSQLTRKDLDNQIFVLNSYLELAKHQLVGQDNIIETVQKGVRSIQSIHETIEYSKDYQDMGAKPPKWQNVNMALLFGLSHISIGNIQHSLETENLEIFADPLLEKVCQRLFENSVKHGDHVTRIRVSQTITPDGVTIFFEDNGIGISAENKEQIFLRDVSTGRASMRSLIFVREILDITGITIRETGEPGKGARFEMVVPKGAYRVNPDTNDVCGGKP